jgi:hypothetical protein
VCSKQQQIASSELRLILMQVACLVHCSLQVRRLGAAHKRTINYPDYTHMDFSWDRNAQVPVDLIPVLQQYSPGTY